MKKFLFLMLGAVTALPGIARDFTFEYQGQTLTYTVLNEDARTCQTKEGETYNGIPGNNVTGTLVIPSIAKDGNIEYSVTSIGDNAFNGCTTLTSVNIPTSVISIGKYSFESCVKLESVTIPDNVSTIGNSAFAYCSSLKSVTIPSSVKSIGMYVFKNCSSLTSVNIPNSVSSIGEGAFEYCKSLSSVTFPASVVSIGEYAFDGCDGLTSVTIPNTVNSIGNGAFSGCSNLKDFIVEDGEKPIAFGESPLSRSPVNLYMGRNWTFHYNYEFSNTMKSVVIGDKVTELPANAFDTCTGLTEVRIGKSVSKIGDYAFWLCKNLKEISIPNSVKSIGEVAFANCKGLTEVIIPNSVKSIGYGAFSNCTGLRSVTISNSVAELNQTFSDCESLTEITIPNSVTVLNRTFENCTGLTSMTIPASVTSVTCPFVGCIKLESINVDAENKNYTSIGDVLFNKEKTKLIQCPATKINIAIPNSVTLIDDHAFSGCAGLTEITIPNSVTSIGDAAFSGCAGLTEITIPNSVTSIGDAAFSGCAGLTSLTIGNSVTSIGYAVFADCIALPEVVLPPSVETIDVAAFYGCSKLTSIIMGHNVRYLDQNVFIQCPVETVCITAQTPPNVDDTSFSDYTGTLYVQGQKAYELYSDDFYCWHQFKRLLLTEPTGMTTNNNLTLHGKTGDTFRLNAKLYPENVSLPQIFWKSTNPEVATVDVNGLVTFQADKSGSTETTVRTCSIIAESLYANGPTVEFSVNNSMSGIGEIIGDTGTSDDIDFSTSVEVYNLQGVNINDNIQNLAKGIYIVRQGKNVRKIAVK